MLNYIVINGRLGVTPELHTTNSNNSVSSFTVAVDRDYRKPGEERQTDWMRCVAWRETADFICSHFTKGQYITLDGRLQARNYTDKSGQERTAYEIIVSHAWFCGPKPEGARNGAPAQPAAIPPAMASLEDPDGDLPF